MRFHEDMPSARAHQHATAPSHGHYVLLRAGEVSWLVAQPQVESARTIEGVPRPDEDPGLFWIDDPEGPAAVVALDESLVRETRWTGQRFVRVRLCPEGSAPWDLWTAWDDVRAVVLKPGDIQPLPEAMHASGAQVTHMANLGDMDDAPAFLVEADCLLGWCLAAPTCA